jgi:S1-C subfamily serine protease
MGRRKLLRSAAFGAIAALVAVGALALVGVFDSDGGGRGVQDLPSVPPAMAQGGQDRIHEIYVNATPGVAFIQAHVVERQTSPLGVPQARQGIATGTGFALDKDGYILTNAHVVEHASDVVVRFREGNAVSARVVGSPSVG